MMKRVTKENVLDLGGKLVEKDKVFVFIFTIEEVSPGVYTAPRLVNDNHKSFFINNDFDYASISMYKIIE